MKEMKRIYTLLLWAVLSIAGTHAWAAQDVGFVIDNGMMPISGATLVIDGYEMTEEILGEKHYMLPVGTHTYTASAPGYATKTGSVEITAETAVVYISLQAAQDVGFVIDNGMMPISGATLVIDGYEMTEEILGEKHYMLPVGTHTYTASAPGYATKTGSVDVTAETAVVYISLQAAQDVGFVIDNGMMPISGATLVIDGYEMTEEILGEKHYMLPVGTHTYTASAPGYATKTGSVEITAETAVVYISLQAAQDVGFVIDNGMMPISGATLVIDGYEMTEEILGEKHYMLPVGTHTYTASAPGYATKTGSVEITAETAVVYISLQAAQDVGFVIDNGMMPISGATLVIDGYEMTEEILGEKHYMLPVGTHTYTASAPGYATKTGSVEITAETAVVYISLQAAQDVGFVIDNGMMPISGATLVIDGYEMTEEILGEKHYMLPVGTHTYTASAPGYATKTGSVEITAETAVVYISLQAAQDVGFVIDNGMMPISGATLVIDGYEMTEEILGEKHYMLPVGTHTYTASAPGYATKTGSVEITAETAVVYLSLSKAYAIKFMVYDGALPVENATISIGDSTQTTSNLGEVNWAGFAAGTYDYTVSIDGFNEATGQVSIENSDVIENVNLVRTGINDVLAQQISLYPNPASDVLQIQFAETEASTVQLSIFDLSGSLVKEHRFRIGMDTQMNISNLKKGLYLLRVRAEDGSVFALKFSKQ